MAAIILAPPAPGLLNLTHGVQPDPFQEEGIAHLLAGRSVVVCAPTGSGKTLVGEAAAALALHSSQRLFYTTPLKALSNQKFRDMCALFGAQRCGLLTGDISIRPDASIVVMTTEVFRNMLITQHSEDRVADVQYVVLDECHYIGHAERGTVWEESILNCPAHIQLVALSATIANAQQVAAWLNQVHPVVGLVESQSRPAPLEFHYLRGGQASPIAAGSMASGRLSDRRGPPDRRRRAVNRPWEDAENPAEVVEELARLEMLPAIYFVFSRQGCHAALEACACLRLVTDVESRAIESRLERWQSEYSSLASFPFVGLLRRGMSVHHAGMLPGWKAAVERLFQEKLVKVVFATDTLAAGINMPARATVISSLRRPGQHGYRPLTATEFHQMAGRAGRRGMDAVGHVVILGEPGAGAAGALRYVSSLPEPLGSCLSPGYGLVLNWLPRFGEEGSRRLIFSGLASARFASARADAIADDAGMSRAPSAWKRFQAARNVLEDLGWLSEGRPTGLGVFAAAMRAENEALVALAMTGALGSKPDPVLTAGLAGALTGASHRPGPGRSPAGGSHSGRGRVGHRLRSMLETTHDIAAHLRSCQHNRQFSCRTTLSNQFAQIAGLWCAGASWGEVLDSTDLDEGDIAYSMRNCMDLLEQISCGPTEPAIGRTEPAIGRTEPVIGRTETAIRDVAADARASMDRPPVSETA